MILCKQFKRGQESGRLVELSDATLGPTLLEQSGLAAARSAIRSTRPASYHFITSNLFHAYWAPVLYIRIFYKMRLSHKILKKLFSTLNVIWVFFILLLSSLKNSRSAFLIISGHIGWNFVHWTYVKMSQNAQTQHSPSGSTPIKVVKKVETAKKYIPSEICQ